MRAGRAEKLGLAISLVSAVWEKVWYVTKKGYKPWLKPGKADVRTNEQGGHTIWYDEQQLLKVRGCSSLRRAAICCAMLMSETLSKCIWACGSGVVPFNTFGRKGSLQEVPNLGCLRCWTAELDSRKHGSQDWQHARMTLCRRSRRACGSLFRR
jgi:hypothetical protein